MSEELDYYGFAENDYQYLRNSYKHGDVANAMIYIYILHKISANGI